MEQKYSKIIVRDADGTLVQMLPEIKTEASVVQNSQYPVTGDAVYNAVAEAVSNVDGNAVHRTGDEYVSGIKTFAQGPYGTASVVEGSAVDLSAGSVFFKSVTEDASFVFENVPENAAACFSLILENAGAFSVSWPESVVWVDGNVPEFDSSGIDIVTFLTPDGGTTWYSSSSRYTGMREFIGASESAAGEKGMVPAPQAAEYGMFLRGDGTWADASIDESLLVHTTGDESIAGAKTFSQGPYGTPNALQGGEIDLAQGTVFTKTVSEDTEFSISGAPSDSAASFSLILVNEGNYSVTWPVSVVWAGGIEPVLAENGTTVLHFLTADGGTVWHGSADGTASSSTTDSISPESIRSIFGLQTDSGTFKFTVKTDATSEGALIGAVPLALANESSSSTLVVNWGDGSSSAVSASEMSESSLIHSYAEAGTYSISMSASDWSDYEIVSSYDEAAGSQILQTFRDTLVSIDECLPDFGMEEMGTCFSCCRKLRKAAA